MDRFKLLEGIRWESRQGTLYVKAKDQDDANQIIYEILDRSLTSGTALFLSGGSTPQKLYGLLSKVPLKPGGVGLIDERYGEKDHEKSNELMIRKTGLLSKLSEDNVPFYPILENKNIENTTQDYDETLRYLFNYLSSSVGILGIGEDGHTAGIPSIREISKKIEDDRSSLVSFYKDEEKYGERITMTFNSLSRLDLIIILVLGKEKKKSLKKMFSEGSISEIPARFFLREDIITKTILISDFKI